MPRSPFPYEIIRAPGDSMKDYLHLKSRIALVYVLAYVYNVLAAVSQLFNAILAGDRDMSFSGRTGYAYRRGKLWARIVMPCIDFILGHGHCLASVEDDEGRETYRRVLDQMRQRWAPESATGAPAAEKPVENPWDYR